MRTLLQMHANANPLNLHVGYSEFMKLIAIEGHRPERPDRDEAPQLTDEIWRLAERCWEGTASARPAIDEVCETIAPSVNASNVPRDGRPKGPDRDEAQRVNDDISRVADRYSEGTSAVRSSIDNIRDNVAPAMPLAHNHPTNTVPRDGGPSTHVQNTPPSAYNRLQSGATFKETFAIPCKYLWAITMTHDSKIIASSGGGSGSGSIQTWDSTSGALRTSLQGHRSYITCLAFFKNGSLVSGSLDKTVRLWDLASPATLILEHDASVACISLSTDNKIIASATGGSDHSVRLWDAATGYLMHTLQNPECSQFISLSLSSDTSVLVALGFDINRSFSSIASRWKQQLDGQWVMDAMRKCSFEDGYTAYNSCSSSGLRFALSKDSRLSIYDLHGNETRVVGGGGAVRFSPDGNWLVGAADHRTGIPALNIWDAASGKRLSEPLFPDTKTDIKEVFISHDGTTILVGCDGSLRVFVLTDR
jgi:hypothetical protein